VKLDTQTIQINPLFPALNWDDVKIHVAQKAGQSHPIDVFAQSFDEWQNDWNGDYHSNHCWNRKYIFSIIEMPKKMNQWLFGGIFKVISHESAQINNGSKNGTTYKVELSSQGNPLIGRLII
jgi:hypothetical protein